MKKHLLIMLLCLQYAITFGQSSALDTSFHVGTGAGVGGMVNSMAIQPDGKIIIGGLFTTYHGTPMQCLARVNTDGGLDTTFKVGSGLDWTVLTIAIQGNGKILIGGKFTHYNGVSKPCIARLNADGSLDSTFNMGAGANDWVETIVIQSDGKILVGGGFTTFNGTVRNRLVRLYTDGTIDTTLNTTVGANGGINAIAVQSDGKIIIGGDFTMYGPNYAERIARVNIDGSGDASYNPAFFGADKVVFCSVIANSGAIYIGGNFENYNNQSRRKIAQINPDGTLATPFNPGMWANQINAGPNGWVNAILPQSNGNLFLVGQFTTYNGVTANRLVMVTPLGELVNSFSPDTGADFEIKCAAMQADGKIIIGGAFGFYNQTACNGLARLHNCTLPQPARIAGDSITLCGGTNVYTINPVAGATNYTWTLPAGWLGSSDSTSIIATSNGNGGTISVAAHNETCGVGLSQSDTISKVQTPAVSICMVTVDSLSTHNIIRWEKPHSGLLDSICIYRETSTNNYTKIATVPFDTIGEYHDYDANPNVTSYRYKISTLDTCGEESPLSLYNSTIHLQNLGSGNLQWTFYQIESSPNPVTTFNIYKDPYGNGNFLPIGLVPGTNSTFSDLNYNSFPNAVYVVDVNWNLSCGNFHAVNTTRSNIRHIAAIDSLGSQVPVINESDFMLYPNPANNSTILRYPATTPVTLVEVFNALGQLVIKQPAPLINNESMMELNLTALPGGIYTVQVTANGYPVNKKLVIH